MSQRRHQALTPYQRAKRIVDRNLPTVLHVRRPKRVRQRGWISIDVTYWKRRLTRAFANVVPRRPR